MRRGFATAAVAGLLSACGQQQLPQPQIISIEPNQMSSSGTANVTVTVDAILPTRVDYGRGQVTVERSLLLSIGTLIIGQSRYENNGVLSAFVPSKLSPGVYDVTLTLVDLRVATLPQAFTVFEGTWPDSYELAPLSDQTRDQSFAVTVRAMRGGVQDFTFNGTVDFSTTRGTIFPLTSGAFVAGQLTENVTISTSLPGGGYIISVQDLAGTRGMSNVFSVN